MAQIYEQYKDLHVVATLVYVGEDYHVYKDAARTEELTPAEFKEVCIKGALLVSPDGVWHMPMNFYSVNDECFAAVYVYADTENEALACSKVVAGTLPEPDEP